MSTLLIEAQNALRVAIEDFLTASDIPLQTRNRQLVIQPNKPWARIHYQTVKAETKCLGTLTIRDRGIVVVSLFFPLNTGTYDCDRISYLLRDSFSEWQYNYLETGIGDVIEVPTTEDYYHVNVNLPYRHN